MESRRVLKELYIGMAIVEAFFLILGIFVMRPYHLFALGILFGVMGAGFMVYHMYDCLDKALDMPPKNARSYITSRSVIRLVISAALMIIGFSIHWVTFVGIAISLISIKVSALVNPLVRRITDKGSKEDTN